MSDPDASKLRRRDFFKLAGAGLTAAGVMMTPRERALAQSLAEKARFERIAGCSWPIRFIFKTRASAAPGRPARRGRGRRDGGPRTGRPRGARRRAGERGPAAGIVIPPAPANRDRTTNAELKQKYGEITMLDFPQWCKDNFPGVTRLDIFSGLFGDVTDDSMFITAAQGGGGGGGFDPMSSSGRKWLDTWPTRS